MTDFEIKVLNDITVETVSKAIIDETSKWGFKQTDYITLVNAILDLSLTKHMVKDFSKDRKDKKLLRDKFSFPITDEHIHLRLFEKDSDHKIVKNWLEDDIGRWFLLSRPNTKTNTLNQLVKDENNILGIITLPDSQPIGLMGFLDYDRDHHKAEMRKLIGEVEYREKGFAKEATSLWIQYGINNLGLKKIYLNTIENNIRNVTLNMELGFQVEGILRKECYIDGKYFDILRMGLIVDNI